MIVSGWKRELWEHQLSFVKCLAPYSAGSSQRNWVSIDGKDEETVLSLHCVHVDLSFTADL